MQNKEHQLMAALTEAEERMREGNYAEARKCFLKAGEVALITASQLSGDVRAKYMRYYRSCLALAQEAQSKIASVSVKAEKENLKNVPDIASNASGNIDSSNTAGKADVSNASGNIPAKSDKEQIEPQKNAVRPLKPVKIIDSSRKQGQSKVPKNRRLNTMAPQWLSEYVGQPDAVNCVSTLINAAKLKDTVVPHLILYGSHGLGKTTFARIIANEMGTRLKEINVNGISMKSMLTMLKSLKPKDIIFIDEIHTMPKEIAESLLYSALQDHRVTYTEGTGKIARTETIDLPPFTLIGATTELGELAGPLIQRTILVRLKEYDDNILAQIISKSFYRSGMSISDADALSIAKRCRNNPRVANNMVNMISSNALVRYAEEHGTLLQGQFNSVEQIRKCNIRITPDLIEEYFVKSHIDKYGLEEGDRQLLSIIVKRYGGGPVSIDTLARAMNESTNVLKSKYEAYLIKKGLLVIQPQGRVALPKAYEVLGLKTPATKKGTSDDRAKSENDAPDLREPDNARNSASEDKKSDASDGKGDNSEANGSASNQSDKTGQSSADQQSGKAFEDIDGTDQEGDDDSEVMDEESEESENYDETNEEERREQNNNRWEKRSVIAAQVPDKEKCDLIESLITYPENVKTFPNADLDELFPDIEKEYDEATKHRCTLEIDIRGKKRTLECDSFLESRFASLMAKTGFLSDIKAQSAELEYISKRLANHKYYPDFIIKDYKGRIAIIEMKNFRTAAYHLNIDKYDELKNFCIEHGYGYAEIMKPNDCNGYISLEMLKNATINKQLEQFIIDRLDLNGADTPGASYFTKEDLYDYKRRFAEGSEQEVYTILLNNRDLRNEDRYGENLSITRS